TTGSRRPPSPRSHCRYTLEAPRCVAYNADGRHRPGDKRGSSGFVEGVADLWLCHPVGEEAGDGSAEMARNANVIRDTARVLHVSPTTVIKELKKRAGVAASESWGAGVLKS